MGLGSGNPCKTGVACRLRGHLGNRYGVPSRAGCSDIAYRPRQTYRDPSHNSKTVLSTVKKARLKGLEPIIWAVLGLPAKARRWYLFQCTVVPFRS